MLAPLIAAPDGMITIDASDFLKKGKESVGVVRQYCGNVGKVESCQCGVFVGYFSDKGYGLLYGRLYMPKSWFSEEQNNCARAIWFHKILFLKPNSKLAWIAMSTVPGPHGIGI